ncbi:MAG: DNA-protecting protein DprA [Rhodobacteraceae bacterium]|nr:DNA-protecting protein DprA [Paracoccaceae bacterium]
MSLELDAGFAEPPLGYTPPPSDSSADRLARLRLIRSWRVGPVTYQRLMAEHGNAAAALKALPQVAEAAGITEYSPCSESTAMAEMKAAKRMGTAMLCLGDPAYPAALTEIPDPPPVLWALGNPALLSRPMIAMVGTRNASSLGARMTRRLATDLGEAGFVIVSGLARGVDALAHAAALATGTVAVHAGGLDVIYPAENTELADQIGRQGVRLSEQPFGMPPQARHFPKRNRLVSGLARAVVVVEAAAGSGSLITARTALDQGREVLAVPGHPMDTRASGCNMLIRDGATLIRGAEDVLEQLGPIAGQSELHLVRRTDKHVDTAQPAAPTPSPGDLRTRILAQLGPAPSAEDQLIRDLGLPPQVIARVLAELELTGEVERRPGGLLSLAG